MDVETQCDFYVKDLSNKRTQTVISKRRSGSFTIKEENGVLSKNLTRQTYINPCENFITPPRPPKFQIIIEWLSSMCKNSGAITYFEKFATSKPNETFPSELKKPYLEVTRNDIFVPQLSLEPARVLVDSEGEAKLIIVFKGCVITRRLFLEEKFLDNEAGIVFESLLSNDFILCPGLTRDAITIATSRPSMPKNIIEYFYPINHICATRCSIWFKTPSSAPIAEISSGKYKCSDCSYVSRYCKKLNKRELSLRCKSPFSRVNLKLLSPNSTKIRLSIARNKKRRLFLSNKKLKEKCLNLGKQLCKKESEEMVVATSITKQEYEEDYESVLGF